VSSSPDQVLDVAGLCSLRTGNSQLQVRIDGADGNDLLRGRQRTARLAGRVIQRGRPGDLIGFGWGFVYLMTDRMRTFLEGSGLTGWFAQAVQIESDLLDGPTWLLGVSGRSGPTYSSGRNPLPGIPRLGEFLDPGHWDGSDFFCPENWVGFLVTGRAAAALRKARLRNLQMECGSLEPLPFLR
jgi:hypothetical protein